MILDLHRSDWFVRLCSVAGCKVFLLHWFLLFIGLSCVFKDIHIIAVFGAVSVHVGEGYGKMILCVAVKGSLV